MKNKELFNRTIAILVKAYQKGTLIHGDCHACAVGNLVAFNTGREVMCIDSEFGIMAWSDERCPYWGDVFTTNFLGQMIYPKNYVGEAKLEIDSTGYSMEDLAIIEKAFESVEIKENSEENSDQHQFDGLMAVVDALMIIHECTTEEAEEAKLLFVK